MPENARKTAWYSTGGPWGSGLFIAGLGTIVLGLSYVFSGHDALPPALQWIDEGLPIAALGSLWLAAGVFAVVQALTPPQQHWHIGPIVAVMCLWSGIYAAHWLVFTLYGQRNHDWQAALAWALFAAMLISWGRCVNPPQRRR